VDITTQQRAKMNWKIKLMSYGNYNYLLKQYLKPIFTFIYNFCFQYWWPTKPVDKFWDQYKQTEATFDLI